jgi:hypothetical protein
MSYLDARRMTSLSIEAATIKLADTILSNGDHDFADTLRGVASEIGLTNIAYLRLSPDKSSDLCLLLAIATYSRAWQQRYFVKEYMAIDPVIAHGRQAVVPFDWADLNFGDPTRKAFLADALTHGVGRNGLSIPLRNRKGVVALVSFTSDLSKDAWEMYKIENVVA